MGLGVEGGDWQDDGKISSYSRQNGLEWPLHPVILISHPKPLKKKKIYIYISLSLSLSLKGQKVTKREKK